MKYKWPLLQPFIVNAPQRPVHYETLIETDLPDLVLAERDGETWLGVLAEASAEGLRWVYAPLSSIERRAVLTGAVELWECFQKPSVLIVDEAGENFFVVATQGHLLPEEALPARGMVLPEWARPPLPAEAAVPEFALARAHTRAGDKIGLKALAALSDAIQRLYVAVTQRLLEGAATLAGSVSEAVRDAAELHVEGLAHGSVLIRVSPRNPSWFETTSDTIHQLLSTTDPAALSGLLAQMGGRVQGRYEDLLSELVTHDLALLVTSAAHQRSFVAAHTAPRRLDALPVSGPREEDSWFARGILVGLDSGQRSFTFYELRTDEEIRGEIAASFDMPPNIGVGPNSPVRLVEIGRTTHATRGGREVTRHQLLRIVADPEGPARPPPLPTVWVRAAGPTQRNG